MKKEDLKKILSALKKEYPAAAPSLGFRAPLQLLVATILSAQCTDARVNIVTGPLFKKYKTASDFAGANPLKFEKEIHSTGFYRNKAKNIIAAAKMILEKFAGKVPDSMKALIQLPGVGRKTANIVLSHAFKKAEGIAVDTHVRRLSMRLGLTKNTDPGRIERDLMKSAARGDWRAINDLFIAHGRAVCVARNPKCPMCLLGCLCPSKKLFCKS